MSVTVSFYVHAKKINSTKRPSGAAAYTANCELKSPCSLTSPTILLKISTSPVGMNYAYIEDFGRYYHVSDWTWLNGLWSASLQVDALATYKTAIGNSSQYVLRSSSDYDGNVVDSLYPTTAPAVVTNKQTTGTIFLGGLTGYYVVGVLNKDTNTAGAVSYYVLTRAQFQTLCGALLDSTDWLQISDTELSSGLVKALVNPFQYITNVTYIPLDISDIGTAVSAIPFGWWSFAVTCRRLSATTSTVNKSYTIAVPKHPNVSRGAYLNFSPYSEYTLHLGAFGDLRLSPELLNGVATIYIVITIDLTSGNAYARVFNENVVSPNESTRIIATSKCPIGVQMPVGQITQDLLAAATSATSGIVSGVAAGLLGDVRGAIGSVIGGISSSVHSATPQAVMSGSPGNLAVFANAEKFTLTGKFLTPVEDGNSHFGKPLCKNKTVNTLSGYVLCSDSDIAIAGTAEEQRSIKDFMDGGFFYE